MKHYLIAILFVTILLTAGCSKNNRPKLVQVEGTVQYKGKPLEQGTIVFDVAGSVCGNAEIKNGQIMNPTTYSQGDGIPVGDAKIAIYSTKEIRIASTDSPYPEGHPGNTTTDSGPPVTTSLIPVKYNSPQTSGLTCTLEKGKKNTVNLELE